MTSRHGMKIEVRERDKRDHGKSHSLWCENSSSMLKALMNIRLARAPLMKWAPLPPADWFVKHTAAPFLFLLSRLNWATGNCHLLIFFLSTFCNIRVECSLCCNFEAMPLGNIVQRRSTDCFIFKVQLDAFVWLDALKCSVHEHIGPKATRTSTELAETWAVVYLKINPEVSIAIFLSTSEYL